ncbi:MAG: ABC transporter permease [Myxococcota bacterium]
MLETLTDIAENLWRHRVRTALTTLSVAWGTFVLVVLLGVGRGLQNSVFHDFQDDATNSIWLYRGQTSRPYQGHPVGRQMRFDDDDFEAISRLDGVEYITGRYYARGAGLLVYGDRSASFSMRAVHPDHRYLEGTEMVRGRWLSDLDLAERRKVTVLSEDIATFLIRDADPIGAFINVDGVPFRVVGTFVDAGNQDEMQIFYVPVTTARVAFGGSTRELHRIMFTLEHATLAESQRLAARARDLLLEAHNVDPQDATALRVGNNFEEWQRIQRIFDLLEMFVWLVGLGTATAGIVGVSNIMLVTVRERTAEIGLRKALGARPGQIVRGIVTESVLLTGTAGYSGIVAGVALLELARATLPENPYIREPEITLLPAVTAAVAVVGFGLLAGLVPAWRAARIHPIDALRETP